MIIKIDNYIPLILDEMFKRVGFEKYDSMFTKQNEWYALKTWTLEEQTNFEYWLVKFLVKRKWNKYLAEKEAMWFVFNFGWKIKEELD